MVTLSVLNLKGGVGKTTIATNIAQALGLLGLRVLVVDNDGQRNITLSLGLTDDTEPNLENVYKNPDTLGDAIYTTRLDFVHLIPSSKKLFDISPSKTALRDILNNETLKSNFDYCIIDNGPALGKLTASAIEASEHYIIPVIPDTFAIQGLIDLMKDFDGDIEKTNILMNKMEDNAFSRACLEMIRGTYGKRVLKTVIPEDKSLREMVSKGKSLLLSKTTSKSVMPILNLLVELFDMQPPAMLAKLYEVRDIARKENFEKNLAPRMFKPGQRSQFPKKQETEEPKETEKPKEQQEPKEPDDPKNPKPPKNKE